MEAPEDYQVDALIRLLDAAATRRRPPCQRYKVAAAGAARDPGSWVAARGRGGRRPGEVRTMRTLSAERCVACRRDSPQVTEAEVAAGFLVNFPAWGANCGHMSRALH